MRRLRSATRRFVLSCANASLLALLLASPARANPDEARARFEEASQATAEGRFAEARDLLRESLSLHPSQPAAFNLAIALRGTGEVREAVRVFERLLQEEFGPLAEERRAQVEALADDVRAEVATIEVHACGAPTIEVRVDGELRATVDDCARARIAVDPGERVVLFGAERADSVERRLRLSRGETASAEALLEVREPEVIVREVPENLAESPWLWVGVGAGVLAVAAAIVVGVVVADPGVQPHVVDDVWGEVVALRFE